MQQKKPNLAGFTLLELIVVIAVMAILTALMMPSLMRTFAPEAGVAAKNINNALSDARLDAMALNGDADHKLTLHLYTAADGIYAETLGSHITNTTKLATKRVSMSPPEVYLSFNRATGALDRFSFDENETTVAANTDIVLSGMETYTISITPLTGYHEVTS